MLILFRFGSARSSNSRSRYSSFEIWKTNSSRLHRPGWPAPDRFLNHRRRPEGAQFCRSERSGRYRMNAMAQAAAPLMKHRFADVIGRDGDRLAAVDVGHRAFVDGLGDRLFNLRFITAQEALAVHRALVLPLRRRSINQSYTPVLHLPTCVLLARQAQALPGTCFRTIYARADTIRRAGEPVCGCSLFPSYGRQNRRVSSARRLRFWC